MYFLDLCRFSGRREARLFEFCDIIIRPSSAAVQPGFNFSAPPADDEFSGLLFITAELYRALVLLFVAGCGVPGSWLAMLFNLDQAGSGRPSSRKFKRPNGKSTLEKATTRPEREVVGYKENAEHTSRATRTTCRSGYGSFRGRRLTLDCDTSVHRHWQTHRGATMHGKIRGFPATTGEISRLPRAKLKLCKGRLFVVQLYVAPQSFTNSLPFADSSQPRGLKP